MSRLYKKKIASFPHARLPTEFYEKLVLGSIFRHPSTSIAKWLGVPIQTVNRNLRRFRLETIIRSEFWNELINRMDSISPVYLYSVDQLCVAIETLAFEEDATKHKISDLYECIYNCPRAPNPSKFRKNYCVTTDVFMDGHGLIPSEDFPIKYLSSKSNRQEEKIIERKTNCRFCPLGSAQGDIMELLRRSGTAFFDIYVHLGQHRARSEFYCHLQYAIALGEIQSYLSNFFRRDLASGMAKEEYEARFDNEVRDLVQAIISSVESELPKP